MDVAQTRTMYVWEINGAKMRLAVVQDAESWMETSCCRGTESDGIEILAVSVSR